MLLAVILVVVGAILGVVLGTASQESGREDQQKPTKSSTLSPSADTPVPSATLTGSSLSPSAVEVKPPPTGKPVTSESPSTSEVSIPNKEASKD